MTRVLDTTSPLAIEPLPADDVVVGSPGAGLRTLTSLGGTEVGVWEMTPGTATDVEADEVFVVLAGNGTLTFADGEVVALAPGVVVRLSEGERTTWVVTETLRKVWLG
ncbi:cupin domain-containing protein [Nocardioides bruguierae]|uniref:Cupin domain-containing protein n=1 Tax=Nocardioides bruguierae TaxID=2945102 RepID=A0A9X2D9C0_9ACTN|nr:cupin domain-containing protein [Nocardioides bruguierae]MCL8026849.1 cupin domain-containing protein [Nocardioides bruguierae]MCM0621439.1 cupin domain-containing protein [Nocardioides bruguierae]